MAKRMVNTDEGILTGVCWDVSMAGYPIRLEQMGKNKFRVTYGQQIIDCTTYGSAAKELGVCIMHALALEGRLNTGE
jgi:hypothetical protein